MHQAGGGAGGEVHQAGRGAGGEAGVQARAQASKGSSSRHPVPLSNVTVSVTAKLYSVAAWRLTTL